MPRSVVLTCALSAAALGLLGADDLEVNDIRLKAGILDTTYKEASPTVTSSSPTYSTTLAKNADSSRRLELEWCHLAFGAGGGLALGVDLAFQQTVFADSDHRTTISTPVADGVAGYCLRLADPLHLEATLFGGMGRSSGDGVALAALRSGSDYYEYGARLALYATIAGSWQLGGGGALPHHQVKPDLQLHRQRRQRRHRHRDAPDHRRLRLPGRARGALLNRAPARGAGAPAAPRP